VKRYQNVSPRASSCVLCVSAAPTGRISVKFDIGDFYEKRRNCPNFVKTGQKYGEL